VRDTGACRLGGVPAVTPFACGTVDQAFDAASGIPCPRELYRPDRHVIDVRDVGPSASDERELQRPICRCTHVRRIHWERGHVDVLEMPSATNARCPDRSAGARESCSPGVCGDRVDQVGAVARRGLRRSSPHRLAAEGASIVSAQIDLVVRTLRRSSRRSLKCRRCSEGETDTQARAPDCPA